jgi:hypothetical protein
LKTKETGMIGRGPDAAAAPPKPSAGTAGEAERPRTGGQIVKDVVLFFAAPFITLAYLSLFPFIGLALLLRAWRHRADAH